MQLPIYVSETVKDERSVYEVTRNWEIPSHDGWRKRGSCFEKLTAEFLSITITTLVIH